MLNSEAEFPLSAPAIDMVEENLREVLLAKKHWSGPQKASLFLNAYRSLLHYHETATDPFEREVALERATALRELYAECIRADIIPLKEQLVSHLSKTVRWEEKNLNFLLDICISAYTEDPINSLVQAKSSSGKTWMIEKVVSMFPVSDTIILRGASPKVFTRERGKPAIKIEDSKGNEEYITEIVNPFNHKKMPVSDYYYGFLLGNLKEAKGDDAAEYNVPDPSDLQEKIEEIDDNGGLYNLVDFNNKILVFLDRPDPKLWKELLSVLSHDRKYTVTKFVEGEGKKRVANVVFAGWPAVIYASTDNSELNWGDLKTRFEVLEPTESPEKTKNALLDAAIRKLGIPEDTSLMQEALKLRLKKFLQTLKDRKEKLHALVPFEPGDMLNELFPTPPELDGVMRTFPRVLDHFSAQAIWNSDRNVLLQIRGGEYVVASKRDLDYFLSQFGGNKLGSMLSGLPETLYEFFVNVVEPSGQTDEGSEAIIPYSDIGANLSLYVQQNAGKTKLRNTKVNLSRYLKALEEGNRVAIVPLQSEDSETSQTTLGFDSYKAARGDETNSRKEKKKIDGRKKGVRVLQAVESNETDSFTDSFKLVSKWFQSEYFQNQIKFCEWIDLREVKIVSEGFKSSTEKHIHPVHPRISDHRKIRYNARFLNDLILSKLGYFEGSETKCETNLKPLLKQFLKLIDSDELVVKLHVSPPSETSFKNEKKKEDNDEETNPIYQTAESVARALKDWGFDVTELNKLQHNEETYKAWISGQISDMTLQQQEFLKTMFDVKFPGSPLNPNILVHFQLRSVENIL